MTFDDGIVRIYNVANNAQPGDMPQKGLALAESFYFHEDSLGITRYYEALKAGQLIERVISIPWPAQVNINQVAVFEDGTQYQVRMVQQDADGFGLKILRLSLERNGEDYEVNN